MIGVLKMDRMYPVLAGNTDLKSRRKSILAILENTCVMKAGKSCLKVITNILIGTILFKLKTFKHILSNTKTGNVMSLDYLMAEF